MRTTVLSKQLKMICSTYLHRLNKVNGRFLHRLISGSCIILVGFSTSIAAVQLRTEAQGNLPKHMQIKADLHNPAPFLRNAGS